MLVHLFCGSLEFVHVRCWNVCISISVCGSSGKRFMAVEIKIDLNCSLSCHVGEVQKLGVQARRS